MSKTRENIRELLIQESRGRCAICGSESHLQLSHIQAAPSDKLKEDNLIVLCPVCNMSTDRVPIPTHVLKSVKEEWVKHEVLGMNQILGYLTPKNKNSVPNIAESKKPEESENY